MCDTRVPTVSLSGVMSAFPEVFVVWGCVFCFRHGARHAGAGSTTQHHGHGWGDGDSGVSCRWQSPSRHRVAAAR